VKPSAVVRGRTAIYECSTKSLACRSKPTINGSRPCMCSCTQWALSWNQCAAPSGAVFGAGEGLALSTKTTECLE